MKKALILIGCLALTVACNIGVSAPGNPPTQTSTVLAPPEPDSSAPAVPVTESTTSTPEPPPPYFTEEFDTPSPYWKFLQTGGAQAPIVSNAGGTLRIDASAPDAWLVGIFVLHSYSNVFIRAKTSITPSGSTGLICRYNEAVGWYEFNVASDGTYNVLLGQWLSPGVVRYSPLVADGNKLPNASSSFEIGLSCQDNLLNLYVNNTLIRRVDVTNYMLADGNIGLAAAAFAEVPMTASFEWARIDEK